MVDTLTDFDWILIVDKIKRCECTPFLGAGVSAPHIPLTSVMAAELAKKYKYPLRDRNNLGKVSQYLAIQGDSSEAKNMVIERWFKNASLPDFGNKNEPYTILANLPFPLYITTNYDNFMYAALQQSHQPPRHPRRIPCCWNDEIRQKVGDVYNLNPGLSPENPVVFHLHGQDNLPVSLVLTEDDYVDYGVEISETLGPQTAAANSSILPLWVLKALSSTSLLFIGYSFSDWNFNLIFRLILHRYIRDSTKKAHISVQLLPGHEEKGWTESRKQRAQDYLDQYFKKAGADIRIFWGTADDFLQELKGRWGKR